MSQATGKGWISAGPPPGRREEKAEAGWHPEGTGSGQNYLRGAEQRENETRFTVSAQLHAFCSVKDEQLSSGPEPQPDGLCSQGLAETKSNTSAGGGREGMIREAKF